MRFEITDDDGAVLAAGEVHGELVGAVEALVDLAVSRLCRLGVRRNVFLRNVALRKKGWDSRPRLNNLPVVGGLPGLDLVYLVSFVV